jgi:hypothetical protein
MPSRGLFRASGSDGICCRRKRRRSYWTSEDSSCRSRYPDMGQDQTSERIKSSRPACQAAKAMAQTAASVRATRGSTADHPKTSGRRSRKKTSTRSKKRSLLMRLPSSAAVQVGAPYSRGRACQRHPVVSMSSMPLTVRRSRLTRLPQPWCGRPSHRPGGEPPRQLRTSAETVR